MNRTISRSLLTAASLVLLFAASLLSMPAGAQSVQPTMKLDVPYEFTVGSKVLPAATYTFSMSDNPNVLLVKSEKSSPVVAFVMARIMQPNDFLSNGSVVFDNNGGRRTIAELWLPGTDGLLLHSVAKDDTRDVVIANYINTTAKTSGKDAFYMTCARCHGVDGNGDANADSFFRTTIPRLTSAMVQRETDAQLTALINKGSKIMPPVETDEGGFRHRLPPQDVSAVIAYVRTLKR